MLSKIKKHWFMLLCTMIFVFYFLFLALIFFAPRVDIKQRGFVRCTTQMIDALRNCGKKQVWCASKIVLKNHACDFHVITEGVSAWLKGTQSTPWANYYFEPVIEQESDIENEELQAYYQQHLHMLEQMEEINKKHIELETELNAIKPEAPTLHKQQDEEINETNN